MRVLIDLDHTLITTLTGETFPISKEDWIFDDTVVSRLLEISDLQSVTIITNQGGIKHGYFQEKDIVEKLNSVSESLETYLQVPVNYFYSDGTKTYRHKPNVAMGLEALQELKDSNPENYIMIGDASGLNKHYDDNNEFVCYDPKNKYNSKKDFSNSDLIFSKRLNIKYYDVEMFKKNGI